MSQQERYECIGCGVLNELDQVNCKSCGVDLFEAKRVWCSEEDAARSDRPVNASACHCPLPGGNVGEMCWACGGQIGAMHLDQPPADQGVQSAMSVNARSSRAHRDASAGQRSERAEKDRTSFHLVLPDGRFWQCQSMVLLGRNIAPLSGVIARGLDGVSRKHVWIGVRSEDLIALDLGSRNGTWLNNAQLRPWEAQHVPITTETMCLRLGEYIEIVIQWSPPR